MQLLADSSDEGGVESGLGLISGNVNKLRPCDGERIPHVGWNEVSQYASCQLFADIPDDTDFYFVHSYHFQCSDEYVVGKTEYCGGFVSAVASQCVYGVQFHPEKSQRFGRKILENFMLV
jgi:glutamine amidotransferase